MAKKIFLISYLAALAAFGPLSTDIYLASMPTIQAYFEVSLGHVQLTLSLFFIVFAAGQIFWGPLSDRIGRKVVIFVGVSIFVLGSLFCALSHSLTQLVLFRMMQAIGACSGIVMAIAIVKDSFPNKTISKVLSTMMSITVVAPMIAPIVGSYLLVHINWQSNFYFLAIYGVALILCTIFLKESHPKNSRRPLPINKLFQAYIGQLKFPPFLLSAMAVSTNFSVVFAFISSSPFIYINIYHLPSQFFGYFFAINALSLVLGSLSLNIFKNKIDDDQIILIALFISSIGSIMMLIAIHFYPKLIWSIVVPSFIVTYGVGIMYPALTGFALKNITDYNGLGSSLSGVLRFILAALIGFLVGIVIKNSPLPLAIVMISMNLFTGISMFFYFKLTSFSSELEEC